jgi:hypothetical protein
VAASPDGRTIAYARQARPGNFWTNTHVTLYELASGQARASLPPLPGFDRMGPTHDSTAFTRDGRCLVTTSEGTALVWDVDGLGAQALTGREWADLAGDGKTGFTAVCSLVVRPAQAIDLLSKKLAPSGIDAKQLRRWLDDLDHEELDARARAEKALAALEDHIEEDLRREATASASTESRLRLRRLLRTIDNGAPSGMRRLRAIEVLERIGTPEAVGLLKRLAGGHAGARQTREAAEALGRLKRR